MSPRQHTAALKMAKREKISFGALVRQAVDNHVEHLKRWVPTKERESSTL